jgi:small-conductance mechanosensitive channel/CRP-like cAMP-binding protein
MPSWEALDDYLDTHAFDGLGLLGAIALLGLAASFVRADERKQLRFPAALLVVFAALYALGEQVTDRDIDPFLHLVALAAILGSVARSSFVVLHALYERQRRAPLPRILQQIVQGSLYAAVGLVVLRAAGVEPGSLLTGSALVTAVIGLSLQETLGNLFAGLAIQAQQPFAVGDWVQFDADPANTAQVIEINWRATRLLTNDRVEITVPNGALARASIRNYSRPDAKVRRAVTIVAPATLPPGEAHRLFLEALDDTEGVLASPAPDCQTLAFTDRGVEYRVRYWLTAFDRREPIDGLVRDRLWYALHRAGLEIPGATRRIFVHETTQEARAEHEANALAARERVLRAIDFLAPLGEGALRAIAEAARRRHFAAGEVVIREGSAGTELYLVEQGELEVLIRRSKGEDSVVARLGPSEFFGERSLMTGEARRATVRAAAPSVVLAVGHEAIAPLLATNPELAEHISRVLAEREFALGHSAETAESRQSEIDRESTLLLDRIRRFFRLGG